MLFNFSEKEKEEVKKLPTRMAILEIKDALKEMEMREIEAQKTPE